MSELNDIKLRQLGPAPSGKTCQCRLCAALDAADAFIHDHGTPPAQAARHLARRSPGLLNVRAFLAALREKT
ncbi:MAG: hypothetical protein ACYDCO_27245 [Armatimonadota bacterium]